MFVASYNKFEKMAHEKGVTPYKVAKDLKMSNVVFSEWKNGKSYPKTDKLKRISDYFGVLIEDFLVETGENNE